MLTRRDVLRLGAQAGAAAALLPAACAWPRGEPDGVWVNDVHSQLNRTRVLRIERPATAAALQEILREVDRRGEALSIMGARHAMGGQQFGSGTVLIDTSGLAGIIEFDADRGEVEVGGGTLWPDLIDDLLEAQSGRDRPWGIVQKQTGADRLSIGGALAANVHGRGLSYRPIVQDVEAFTLVDARGDLRRCSRTENEDLFRLAIGGYGLFGPIASVRLRLAPRRRIERVVEVTDTAGIARRFADRIAEGYLFGDFQFATAPASESLLRTGVFSCYRPVRDDRPSPERQPALSREEWLEFIRLGHLDREKAFHLYSEYYLQTSGQAYWSDTHQLSTYIDDYHRILGRGLGPSARGSEMITEIYVPRDDLAAFMEAARSDFIAHEVDLIYGTVRLIEPEAETFLGWARRPWACIIFNLHTAHDGDGLIKTAADFRRLIDRAREHGGAYYLTYHRWATRDQVIACYPQMPAFLAAKHQYDPRERFQSDWYRHYRRMFPA